MAGYARAARALRLGGLLVPAFRGRCVATAAIRPPVYLIRYPPPRGPCHARNPGRLAPITTRPAAVAMLEPAKKRSARAVGAVPWASAQGIYLTDRVSQL